jgi:hypothetical protein
MPVPADRFDQIRRSWIARHQGAFLFQKRRAEILAQQIRDRAGEDSGAGPDPADDNVIDRFWMRPLNTRNAALEALVIGTAALLAPVGWPLGIGIYRVIVQLIPDEIRSYPIAALMWASVVIGLPMVLFYEPGDSLVTTVAAPYLFAQIPAAALAAGMYGILEGWLAVAGSRDWWPMRPPPASEVIDFGWEPDV